MKLKSSFVTQDVGGEQIMVAADSTVFKGLVRSNETAAFIVNALKNETTRGQIIAAMLEEYDAAEEVIARDVDMVLDKLRSIGAIDE